MLHGIVELPQFIREAERHGMTEQNRDALKDYIAANPEAGDLIQGSGGCRKVRWPGKGKGKSGGFRAITFYSGHDDVPVFLFTVYAKDKLKNLSDAQVNMMKLTAKATVEEYRKRKTKKR